ncbi:MAG: hypothetical protein CMP31_02280 [Roseibacillus sp.]|nr:hypothetical protein [Roseibacillus sp.]
MHGPRALEDPVTPVSLRQFFPCAAIGVGLGLFTSSCSDSSESGDTGSNTSKVLSADATFRAMVATEETIAELVPSLNRLGRAVRDLSLPGHFASPVFAMEAVAIDLGSAGDPKADARLPLQHHEWEVSTSEVRVADLRGGLWKTLWEEADGLEDARFGVLRGRMAGDGAFVSELTFSARGWKKKEEIMAWKGRVDLHWQKNGESWQITRWVTRQMHVTRAAAPLFREVLGRALPNPSEYRRARSSIHERYLREVFFTGSTTFAYPKDYWIYVLSWDSLDQHTSVSVVDIDQDGWDDFYVTARWGRNQLWRNRGDGTFTDIAPRVGLDIDGVCNCALFADFDNDGDQDAFIGRSLERGQYYLNEGGRFIESSNLIDAPLPYWASALSATDFNQDGLLDLYISTYRLPISKPMNILASRFLEPLEREEFKNRRRRDHPVFRLTGPPNVLLVNLGNGRFARVPEAGGTDLWLSTFQSTWSDYDNDGDPDLFVANDYAPDYVFRNDGGTFVDATRELAGEELQGFGMGVSLGDYDNDGRQDPYFTYMYSKAGSRITGMFEGLERRMYEGVAGNKLLRNTPDGFENVSGHGPGKMQVMRTGWSWGGQFSDFDNDGFLDLYVANGLYTPPPGTATEVDL